MLLYLVQHGASKGEAEDPARPLTEEGARTAQRMAAHLAGVGMRLDVIEHSDKLRARQTAEILAVRLQPANGTRQVAGLAPNDDTAPLRARLQQETRSLMLVGHLPQLSRLASLLLGRDAQQTTVRFQMGGVVCLEREESGHWVLRWMLTPDLVP